MPHVGDVAEGRGSGKINQRGNVGAVAEEIAR